MAVGVVAELDCEGSAGAEGDYCCGCLRWRSLGGRYRPRAAVELLGKLSFNVLAQGREAGLPAERPSGAVG